MRQSRRRKQLFSLLHVEDRAGEQCWRGAERVTAEDDGSSSRENQFLALVQNRQRRLQTAFVGTVVGQEWNDDVLDKWYTVCDIQESGIAMKKSGPRDETSTQGWDVIPLQPTSSSILNCFETL
jgi:hypothetical protein